MITIETAMAALDELAKKKNDGNNFIEVITAFTKEEPNYVGFLISALSSLDRLSNPLSAAVFAVALYERLRKSQENSDQLKKDFK